MKSFLLSLQARRTRELSAYGKVHSCNLPYAKTSRVRATFGKVLFIRAKNLSKVARTRRFLRKASCTNELCRKEIALVCITNTTSRNNSGFLQWQFLVHDRKEVNIE